MMLELLLDSISIIIIDIIINIIIATKKQQNMKSITSAILKAMFCLGDVYLLRIGRSTEIRD